MDSRLQLKQSFMEQKEQISHFLPSTDLILIVEWIFFLSLSAAFPDLHIIIAGVAEKIENFTQHTFESRK